MYVDNHTIIMYNEIGSMYSAAASPAAMVCPLYPAA